MDKLISTSFVIKRQNLENLLKFYIELMTEEVYEDLEFYHIEILPDGNLFMQVKLKDK